MWSRQCFHEKYVSIGTSSPAMCDAIPGFDYSLSVGYAVSEATELQQTVRQVAPVRPILCCSSSTCPCTVMPLCRPLWSHLALACISIVGAVGRRVAECEEEAQGGEGGRTGGNEGKQFTQCQVIHSSARLQFVEIDRHCSFASAAEWRSNVLLTTVL